MTSDCVVMLLPSDGPESTSVIRPDIDVERSNFTRAEASYSGGGPKSSVVKKVKPATRRTVKMMIHFRLRRISQ